MKKDILKKLKHEQDLKAAAGLVILSMTSVVAILGMLLIFGEKGATKKSMIPVAKTITSKGWN